MQTLKITTIFILLSTCSITAQVVPNLGSPQLPVMTSYYALDIPADARSIAMGESFVALGGAASSHFYNPAGLASIPGLTISYSRRYANLIDPTDIKYQNFSASLRTSIANIGLFYSRFDYDDNIPSSNPIGTGSTMTEYNYVAGISLARTFCQHFQLGITSKIFNRGMTFGSPTNLTTNHPILFDFGSQYSSNGFLNNSFSRDEIRGGIALQNFGTDLRLETLSLGDPDRLERLPRYLRIGFAYTISILSSNPDRLQPFSFLLTGEYRNLLNGSDSQSDDRDFWGYGAEFTFFKLVSVRMGEYISPKTWLYGNRGIPGLRYGAGLHIPLQYLIQNLPLELTFNYTAIPLSNSLFIGRNMFPAYSLEAHYYTGEVF